MRINRLLILCNIIALICLQAFSAVTDTVPSGYSRAPQWHIGAEVSPAAVIGSNPFLKGHNSLNKAVTSLIATDVRAGFSFNKSTLEGILYKDTYQGIGIGLNTFSPSQLLGTPISVFIYQGAPIAHLNDRFWIGYEWQFGADIGWKHFKTSDPNPENLSLSTRATAHMGLRLTLNFSVNPRLNTSIGIQATHSSNGNTSWPNGGVNSVGAAISLAYILNPSDIEKQSDPNANDLCNAYQIKRWFYDITLYGATRKRVVYVGNPAEWQLCPGHFAVAGIQFSPMRQLNRWFATGGSLDLQWDESAGLAPYWVTGSYRDTLKFRRPPFDKQISIGLAAHAELIMPIFTVNAGIGYNIVNPRGDKRLYQSLTLKAFVLRKLYLNVGYRLGKFRDPENLMIGAGIRL